MTLDELKAAKSWSDIITLLEYSKPNLLLDCLIWIKLQGRDIVFKDGFLMTGDLRIGKITNLNDKGIWLRMGISMPRYTSDVSVALDTMLPDWEYKIVKMPGNKYRTSIRANIDGSIYTSASSPGMTDRCCTILSASLGLLSRDRILERIKKIK